MYSEGRWSFTMVPTGVGIVRAYVTFYSADLSNHENLELIVDTGSLFTWIPKEIALRLGVRPQGSLRFRTIDGTVVKRLTGDCLAECEGIRGYVPVVFRLEGDAQVLGVTALERFGLEIDPRSQTLKRIDAYLALVSA